MKTEVKKSCDKVINRVIKLGNKVSRKDTFIQSAIMDIEEEHKLDKEGVEQCLFYIEIQLLDDPSKLWTGTKAKSSRLQSVRAKLQAYRISLCKDNKHLELIEDRVVLTLEDGTQKWLDDNCKTYLSKSQLKAKKEMLGK